MAEHIEIGKIGEQIAHSFLMKHGFSLLDQNYRTPYGEIDIVAEKNGITHFVEVKSKKTHDLTVAHETTYRPEENVHSEKQKRLIRVINTFIAEKHVQEGRWQFDIVSVYLDSDKKQAKVTFLENIIL